MLVGGGIGLAAFVAAVLAVRLLRSRLIVVTVSGDSMAPTYRDGERVVVRRRTAVPNGEPGAGEPGAGERAAGEAAAGMVPADGVAVGDVVVVAGFPAARIPAAGEAGVIKRVAAVPGDPLPAWLPHPYARQREHADGEGRVPSGRLVLLGDNPAVSTDSRTLGLFEADALLGRVVRPRRVSGGAPGHAGSGAARP